MTIKPKVTIGISAYNEENNIRKLLTAILNQKSDNFVFEKVIIISDGSTDDTIKEVQKNTDKRINLFESKERLGKSARLNQIFMMSSTDILVLFDADVSIEGDSFISTLVQPLIDNHNVALVASNCKPMEANTFIEKAVNISFYMYDRFRWKIRNGSNPHVCVGRSMGLKKDLYKNIKIPDETIGNDSFIYFSCLKFHKKFIGVRDAVVVFKSPDNLNDHFKQNRRFTASPLRQERIFGSIVRREYFIPRFLFIEELFLAFVKDPILATSIFVLNRYCSLQAKFLEPKMGGKWQIAKSTKELT